MMLKVELLLSRVVVCVMVEESPITLNIEFGKNAVLFVGYQAKGTLGRQIVEGAEWINLYGEDIIVKASIHTINGFSAHADQKAMIKWISKIKKLKKIFLIHGEVESQETFKEAIKEKIGIDSHIVKYEEKILI